MTYKSLRRKSDGQWFGLSWDYPVGLYNASAPQFFDTTIAELSLQWQEFNPDFYIDWSLYELVEVAVIPVDEFPSEEEIIQNEHLIIDEYENVSKDQKWFMGVGFRLCATWLLNKMKGK